ncbi:MAG: sigma-70 family RNA polymerase sigma factor [Bacteroidales bacterium]|nr:sigma-70 family RNA polymerase sigma factor [Bacteroidales bacterium]
MTVEEFTHQLLPLKDKLFRFSYRLLGNRDDAHDAVQDVYLKMWNIRGKLKEVQCQEALMMTTTRNLCLDRLKSKSNKFITLHEEFGKGSEETPQSQIENLDMLSWVKREMELLPEQQKTLLHLRDMEQLDFDEIAEITGFDLNYIRVNLSRARKRIRERIQEINSYATTGTKSTH